MVMMRNRRIDENASPPTRFKRFLCGLSTRHRRMMSIIEQPYLEHADMIAVEYGVSAPEP